MNKKAKTDNMVAGNIIYIILLIIFFAGFAIFFYVAWKIYSVYTNQEEKNAQALIDKLEAKLNALEDEQSAKLVFNGFASKTDNGWSLRAWSKNDVQKPDKCYFESCICICQGLYNLFEQGSVMLKQSSDREACQNKGFCKFFDKDNLFLGTSTIATIKIGLESREEVAINYPIIKISENFFELEINKSKDFINITYFKPKD